MFKKNLDKMEQKLQHDKRPPNHGIMGALKKHFKGKDKEDEEGNEKKSYKSKEMNKDSRKKMAIMLIKKKMS